MSEDIKEILDKLEIVARKRTIEVREDGSKIETMPACLVDELRLNNYSAKILYDYITNLQEENIKLKELCDKYEEEHKTTFIEWQKDINILKEIKQWLEVNDRYSQGYFKQVLEYINILKGSDKE